MFVKRLCVEGCNEAILLQPSSRPILGGNYIFIGKEESHRAQPQVPGVGGVNGGQWGRLLSLSLRKWPSCLDPRALAGRGGVGREVRLGPGGPCYCTVTITEWQESPLALTRAIFEVPNLEPQNSWRCLSQEAPEFTWIPSTVCRWNNQHITQLPCIICVQLQLQ